MSVIVASYPIGQVVYFEVTTHNPTTAAISDADSLPTFDVYHTSSAVGQLGNTNMTKRGSLTGEYYGTFTITASTPTFTVGDFYSIVATATVAGVTGKLNCGSFRVVPAENVVGVPIMDAAYWKGVAGPNFPTNFSVLSIDANGRVKPLTGITKNVGLNGFMFVMTDSTLHAPTAGFTVTGTVSLDGSAFTSLTNSASSVSQGWYKINLANADVNGNNVALRFSASGADDTDISFITSA